MIVDFHNHFFPKAYLEGLKRLHAKANVEQDTQGRTVMVVNGDYNIIVPEHHDALARIAALDAAGIDLQCLTLTVPGTHSEEAQIGLELAQRANDGFAEVMAQHPQRFVALATLPLQDPQASVRELERAVRQGLRGATLFSNINGQSLDHESFWPLYEKAIELEVPLFIHPIVPHHVGAMKDYRLVAVMGFLFDTSVAASRLIYGGVLKRYPELQLVLAHLGGTLPFLAERMDRGFEVYPECRVHIDTPPSHYLKQMYMDTFPYTPEMIGFSAQFLGADKILMGSDYPHQIGDLKGGISTIAHMNLSESDKRLMLGENARQLLKIA